MEQPNKSVIVPPPSANVLGPTLGGAGAWAMARDDSDDDSDDENENSKDYTSLIPQPKKRNQNQNQSIPNRAPVGPGNDAEAGFRRRGQQEGSTSFSSASGTISTGPASTSSSNSSAPVASDQQPRPIPPSLNATSSSFIPSSPPPRRLETPPHQSYTPLFPPPLSSLGPRPPTPPPPPPTSSESALLSKIALLESRRLADEERTHKLLTSSRQELKALESTVEALKVDLEVASIGKLYAEDQLRTEKTLLEVLREEYQVEEKKRGMMEDEMRRKIEEVEGELEEEKARSRELEREVKFRKAQDAGARTIVGDKASGAIEGDARTVLRVQEGCDGRALVDALDKALSNPTSTESLTALQTAFIVLSRPLLLTPLPIPPSTPLLLSPPTLSIPLDPDQYQHQRLADQLALAKVALKQSHDKLLHARSELAIERSKYEEERKNGEEGEKEVEEMREMIERMREELGEAQATATKALIVRQRSSPPPGPSSAELATTTRPTTRRETDIINKLAETVKALNSELRKRTDENADLMAKLGEQQ
ncbi:hypothetical protein RQP46_002226 [Phenoliferia psychrophenolica]